MSVTYPKIESADCCRMKILGKLPQVHVTLSDSRIVDVSQLILSIALPDASLPEISDDEDSDYMVSYPYLSHGVVLTPVQMCTSLYIAEYGRVPGHE